MTVKMNAAKKREGIRDEILDAAVREFARNGVRGASMQAIADEIGISKAKLNYMTSKEDLYERRSPASCISGTTCFRLNMLMQGRRRSFADTSRAKCESAWSIRRSPSSIRTRFCTARRF